MTNIYKPGNLCEGDNSLVGNRPILEHEYDHLGTLLGGPTWDFGWGNRGGQAFSRSRVWRSL